jgi:hypothetical protein
MTNEEKTNEICCKDCTLKSFCKKKGRCDMYKSTLRMAAWKDTEFQKFVDSLGITVKELYEKHQTKRNTDVKVSNDLKLKNLLEKEPHLIKHIDDIANTFASFFIKGEEITIHTNCVDVTFKFK